MSVQLKNPIDLVGQRHVSPSQVLPYLVEVDLPGTLNSEDEFLILRETLTRLGVPYDRNLYQTCHLLHKRGRYYIVHFKMMFIVDGRNNHLTVDDIGRMHRIIKLVEQWGLAKVVNPSQLEETPICPINKVKILSQRDAKEQSWNLLPKYRMGTSKVSDNESHG